MDDITIYQQEVDYIGALVLLDNKKQPSIIWEQFYLKYILFFIKKLCKDVNYYLKFNKNACLRRKRKKIVILM